MIKRIYYWIINNLILLCDFKGKRRGVFVVVKAHCQNCNHQYIAAMPLAFKDEDMFIPCPNCNSFAKHSYSELEY
jgi:transcription elongation factor Elf1